MTTFALAFALAIQPALAGDVSAENNVGMVKTLCDWIKASFSTSQVEPLVLTDDGTLVGTLDVETLGAFPFQPGAPIYTDWTLTFTVEAEAVPTSLVSADFLGTVKIVTADGRPITATGPMQLTVLDTFGDGTPEVAVDMWRPVIDTSATWAGSLESILVANAVDDPMEVAPGAELVIPGSSELAEVLGATLIAEESSLLLTVAPGDIPDEAAPFYAYLVRHEIGHYALLEGAASVVGTDAGGNLLVAFDAPIDGESEPLAFAGAKAEPEGTIGIGPLSRSITVHEMGHWFGASY